MSSCPTERLKFLLQERQIDHGPIVKSTKRVYMYQLKKTRTAPVDQLPKIPRLGKSAEKEIYGYKNYFLNL